jgi:hypothetical protein
MTAPRPSLETRASGVRISKPKPGQDRRTGDQYRAALQQETEATLRRSPSWRAGGPLLEEERWSRLTTADLPHSDLPTKGRWA